MIWKGQSSPDTIEGVITNNVSPITSAVNDAGPENTVKDPTFKLVYTCCSDAYRKYNQIQKDKIKEKTSDKKVTDAINKFLGQDVGHDTFLK